MYPRQIESRLREALRDTPVVCLSGPRQAGKSTLAKKVAGKSWPYLTLDDATVLNAARSDPNGFIKNLDKVVIDEIQRAPEVLIAIKKSVDEDRRPGRFLITGSANVLTIPRVKESLAGRMEIIPLYPLSRSEILGRSTTAFLTDLFKGRVVKPTKTVDGEEMMELVLAGGFPDAIKRPTEKRRRDWCHAYLDAIAERDIKDIARVDKITNVRKLIEVLAHHSAQLVNFTTIGSSLGLDHKTAARYINLLESMFLVQTVQPWFRNHLKRLIKTPKLHFIDAGLLAVGRGQTSAALKKDRATWGPLLESFVYAELLKQSSWAEEHHSIFHYRDKDQAEVDFVIENASRDVVGVEVKAAATVRSADFNGLRRLKAAVGNKQFKIGLVLYDGDQILPFEPGLWAAPIATLWN